MSQDLLEYAENGNFYRMAATVKNDGADINYQNDSGYSAMTLAACNGRLKCVKWLAESGANLELADKNGMTPILAAAEEGQFEIVKLLHCLGANIYAKTVENESIADIANVSAKNGKVLMEFIESVFEQDQLNSMIPHDHKEASEFSF